MKTSHNVLAAKVYSYKEDIVSKAVDIGLNTIFSGISGNDETKFRKECSKVGITFFKIIEIFINRDNIPGIYSIDNYGCQGLEDWFSSVCPTNEEFIEDKVKSILQIINREDPEGISLDFIRYFVFWEKTYSDTNANDIRIHCFCQRCLSKFENECQIEIPFKDRSSMDASFWILENHRDKFSDWKCNVINNAVRTICNEVRSVNPNILIAMHAVPWRDTDFDNGIRLIAGQDFKALSEWIDIISPMCYHWMLRRNVEWIRDIVRFLSNKTNRIILPSIQVEKCYMNESLPMKDFEEAVMISLEKPSSGISLWNLEELLKNKNKLNALKKSLKEIN